MRKTILLFSILFSSTLFAQSWVQVADIPSGRHHPVTFTLDGKGYSVTGTRSNGAPTDDFYMYDADSNTWTTLIDFPGAARSFAIGVTYAGKAYMGFGATNTQYLNDLWEYDADTDQWTQLASCPGSARRHPALIASAGKIYMGLGDNGNANLRDWWEYDIDADSWTQMADLPGPRRHHPFQFEAGGNVYAGMGHGGNNIYDDWYKLDTATNTWTAVNDFPGEARVAGTQFSFGGYGYVLSGDGDNHSFMPSGEMWRYNPLTDVWNQLTPHPGISRWAPGSFIIENEVYFFGGRNRLNGQYPDDVWKFDLAAGSIGIQEDLMNSLTVYPNPARNQISWDENESISEIRFVNALGQNVAVASAAMNNIDISNWTNGFYFVQFYVNGEWVKTEKLIIKN